MDRGIAGDPGHGAERLLHRLAERYPDILGGVVMVDVKVAVGLDGEVDARMAGQKIEHMVEKADSGGNAGHAGAVEVYRYLDIGFLGLAPDGCRAHENPLSRPENAPF